MSKREQVLKWLCDSGAFAWILLTAMAVCIVGAIVEDSSSGSVVPTTCRCRMAEVNHVTMNGDIYGTQVIFWGWKKREWHVMDFLLVDKQFRTIPKSPWIISVDGKVYKIYYDITSESWTDYDPEMRERVKLSPDERDRFFKGSPTRGYSQKASVLRAEA